MDLGKIIRNYRELNGLSLRQFAARCNDISAGYISIIELGANPATGKPSMPSVEKLSSIAQGMGMTLDELLEKMEVKRDRPVQAQPEKQPRPTNALPYTPSRSMVAVVGSVRCGPPNAAYTNTHPCRAGVCDERQQESPGVMPGRFLFLAGADVFARPDPVVLVWLMLIDEPVPADLLGGAEPAPECLLPNDDRVFVVALGVLFQRDQSHQAFTSS